MENLRLARHHHTIGPTTHRRDVKAVSSGNWRRREQKGDQKHVDRGAVFPCPCAGLRDIPSVRCAEHRPPGSHRGARSFVCSHSCTQPRPHSSRGVGEWAAMAR